MTKRTATERSRRVPAVMPGSRRTLWGAVRTASVREYALAALCAAIGFVCISRSVFWYPVACTGAVVGGLAGVYLRRAVPSALTSALVAGAMALTLPAEWAIGTVWSSAVLLACVSGASGAAVAALAGRRGWLASLLLTAMICAILVGNAIALNTQPRGQLKSLFESVSMEPPAHGYNADAHIFLRAYYRMVDGLPYYEAFSLAFQEAESSYWGRPASPLQIRQPLLFYFWRILAPHAVAIYYLLFAGLAGLMFCAFAIASKAVGEGLAVLAPALLFPLCTFLAASELGLYMEAWALCAAFGAVALVAWQDTLGARAIVVSAGLAAVAVMMRETFALYLVAGVVMAVASRERTAIVAWLGSLGVAAVAFAVHVWRASAFVVPNPAFSAGFWKHGGVAWLEATAAVGQDMMLGAPILSWLAVGAGVAGIIALWPNRLGVYAAVAVGGAIAAFMLVGIAPDQTGYSGAYWGLTYAPIALTMAPAALRYVPWVRRSLPSLS